MLDGSVQRRFPRYAIQLPLLYQSAGGGMTRMEAGWTRSIAEGGATLELSGRLPPETPLWIRLQTQSGPIEMEGRIVWVTGRGPEEGGVIHGVAFAQIVPAQLRVLRALLRSLAMVRQAEARLPVDIPVTCRPTPPSEPQVLQGRTGNLSRGGILLRLPRLLPPNTTLEVTLHTEGGPLIVQGAIAWVEPHELWRPGESIGHGVRFTSPSWTLAMALGSLLGTLP